MASSFFAIFSMPIMEVLNMFLGKIFDKLIIEPAKNDRIKIVKASFKIADQVENELVGYCRKVNEIQQSRKES